jgi:hypothetical protein
MNELPSSSHSKFPAHHLPKDDQRDLVKRTDQAQPEHFSVVSGFALQFLCLCMTSHSATEKNQARRLVI